MSYDNSNVAAYIGGHGLGTSAVNTSFAGRIQIDTKNRIRKNTTATSIKVVMTRTAAQTIDLVSGDGLAIKFFSTVNDSDYTIEASVDMTAEYNALTKDSSIQTVTKTISVPVQADWMMGWYIPNVKGLSGTNIKTESGLVAGEHESKDSTEAVGDVEVGDVVTPDGTRAGWAYFFDLFDFDNEYIITDDDNATAGFADGDVMRTGYFTTENQYIVLEDINVPDTEDLVLELLNTNLAGGAENVVATIQFNFDGGANDNKFTKDNFATDHDITGYDGQNFNLHIWNDLANDNLDFMIANYDDATNIPNVQTLSGSDYKNTSLTDRTVLAAGVDLSATYIRRIRISQNTGSAVTIGKVVVCRKPIIIVGDSYVSRYNDALTPRTALNRIGAAVGAAFTETRYVINAGITGEQVLLDTGASTGMLKRWDNTFRDDDTVMLQRDAITVLVGSVNDINRIEDDEDKLKATPAAIAGAWAHLIGDVRHNEIPSGSAARYDAIIVGNVVNTTLTAQEQQGQKDLNAMLQYISSFFGIPFVNNSNYPFGFEGAHLENPAGDQYVADRIAEAWENDLTGVRQRVDSSWRSSSKP